MIRMRRNRVVILSLFIVMIVLGSSVFTAIGQAPYYDDASLDADVVVSPPQLCQDTHSATGKLVYAYWDVSEDNAYFIVYSANGDNEALVTQGQDYSSYSMIVVSDFGHATDMLIILCSQIGGGAQHVELRAYRFNVNTYAITYIGEEHIGSQMAPQRVGISEAIEYNDDLFWVYHAWDLSADTHVLGFLELDLATDTLSTTENTTLSQGGAYNPNNGYPPLMTVQDPLTSSLVYIMTADADDDERPTFYRLNLAGVAGDIVQLATAGTSNALNNEANFQWSISYFGGGVEDSGNLRYLYFTYAYGYHYPDNNRAYRFSQQRLIFNTSGGGEIIEANLTAQNVRNGIFSPNLGASASYVGWTVGYMTDYDEINMYMSNYLDGEYVVMLAEIDITTFFDYATTVISYDITYEDYDETIYTPRNEAHSHISRDWDSTFQSDYSDKSDDLWRVWYYIEALEENYDISISYTPTDDPLDVNTNYQFTTTTTLNGIGTEVINIVYWDGSQVKADYSETNGVFQFTLISSIGGIHNLTVSVWDGEPPAYKYSESWSYTFSGIDPTADPTTPTLVTTTISLMVYFIPVLVIIIFPAFMFFKILDDNIFGGLFGLSLGVIICNVAGYLPVYTIYLMLLIDIAIVLQEVRT